MNRVSLIFLAGGNGSRMQLGLPKQFLTLGKKPVAHHSLEVFQQIQAIEETIIVCAPAYRHLFEGFQVKFAQPGAERQDSVYNGLQEVDPDAEWVLVHDAARPFIAPELIQQLFTEGKPVGAAALAMPVKNTLKEICPEKKVRQTLDRSCIWEIQTPQLLKKEILKAGFAFAQKHQTLVTDDVSLAELIGHPVHLVRGSYQNIKITTPEDWAFAEWVITNIG